MGRAEGSLREAQSHFSSSSSSVPLQIKAACDIAVGDLNNHKKK